MLYKNPDYRKAKGGRRIIVMCAHCKTEIILYEKVGPGGLLRMYVDRIIESSIKLPKGGLFCPDCSAQLGARGVLRRNKKQAYRLIRGAFNVREAER